MSTVSACMIVKNEEELLPACLKSIKDWVDEIIVVDTGSTDKTKEIAKQMGAKVFNKKWQDDFSAVRNLAMSKATCEWIFTIDADEVVAPKSGEILKKMLPDIKEDIIGVNVYSLYGPQKVPRTHLVMLRFFRRSTEPRYVGRVHNRPVIKGNAKVHLLPFTINHYGYDVSPEVMAQKDERRLRMCKRWTEEEPKKAEAWHHLAMAMKTKGGKPNFDGVLEVIKVLKKGLAVSYTDGNLMETNVRAQILSQLAWMNHVDKNFSDAIGYGKKALAIKPDYLDPILAIGLAYTYGLDALEGETWLLRYLREQEAYKFINKLDCIATEHTNDRALAFRALIDIEKWKNNNVKSGEVIK